MALPSVESTGYTYHIRDNNRETGQVLLGELLFTHPHAKAHY